MKFFTFCVLVSLLSGCSAKVGTIPAEALGNLAGDGVVFASDGVQEVAIRANARNKHAEEYGSAYKESGLEVKFEVVEINGTAAYMPTKLTFKEKPQFGKAPDLDPTPHPGYRLAETLGMGVMKYGVIGYGIHEAAGAVEALAERGNSESAGLDASGGGSIEYNSSSSEVTSGGDGVGAIDTSEAMEVYGADEGEVL